MNVEVKLFAGAAQAVDSNLVQVTLSSPATIGSLREALSAEFPSLRSVLASSMIAVNESYANDDVVLSESAEIAVIPPVSGG